TGDVIVVEARVRAAHDLHVLFRHLFSSRDGDPRGILFPRPYPARESAGLNQPRAALTRFGGGSTVFWTSEAWRAAETPVGATLGSPVSVIVKLPVMPFLIASPPKKALMMSLRVALGAAAARKVCVASPAYGAKSSTLLPTFDFSWSTKVLPGPVRL